MLTWYRMVLKFVPLQLIAEGSSKLASVRLIDVSAF